MRFTITLLLLATVHAVLDIDYSSLKHRDTSCRKNCDGGVCRYSPPRPHRPSSFIDANSPLHQSSGIQIAKRASTVGGGCVTSLTVSSLNAQEGDVGKSKLHMKSITNGTLSPPLALRFRSLHAAYTPLYWFHAMQSLRPSPLLSRHLLVNK